jgi:hypothetical protein
VPRANASRARTLSAPRGPRTHATNRRCVAAQPFGPSMTSVLRMWRFGLVVPTALVLLLISGLARCSRSSDDMAPHSGMRPNVRGADIRVVADRGVHDPAPVVLPAAPRHLVIDDCRGFVLFHVPDTFNDPDRGIVILNWSEGNDNRSLTILAKSLSCASHEGVKRLLELNRAAPDTARRQS